MIKFHLLLLLLSSLLFTAIEFHSVAVVLTLITNRNKYIFKKKYKSTINKIAHITKNLHNYQNTHTHTHITKTPHIHTPHKVINVV